MDFMDIVEKRHATRKFSEKKVDEAAMKKLFEIIRLSPSSLNLQPWKIKVITDAKTKQALTLHTWNQPQINSCSHLLVFCADTSLEEKAKSLYEKMDAQGLPAEDILGFSKMVDGFVSTLPKESRLPWAQRQVYIALGFALLGAKSLGLDSCPMEGFSAAEYSKALNLPPNLVPSALCPVGYGVDAPRKKVRFGKEDVFF